jgi:glycosyltransferase involved in cell wall biosynthesis
VVIMTVTHATETHDDTPCQNSVCSVIICAYTAKRWDDTMRAVASAQAQQPAPNEVILVVDHNPELLARLAEALPGVRVVCNASERGSSGARNTGVALATGDIMAFLDDDAVAQPGWLAALTAHYANPEVMGVGGRTTPGWATNRPRWWPPEFDWVIGCAYTGREPGIVRNLHGGNDSFRRDVFANGGFPPQIARSAHDRRPLSGEATEFCIRASKAWPRRFFIYDDRAVITHRIPEAREKFSYFCSRCFSEGLSKAVVTTSVGLGAGLATERRYTAMTLPIGVLRGLRRAARGDWAALLPAVAIVVGLMSTALGYVFGSIQQICHRGSGGAR